ncbi:hypothetical protein PS015_23990, partial [Shigella sonnei]|nr:hypothetical protein [Shigella sonnei]
MICQRFQHLEIIEVAAIRGWDRRNFYYFQMLKSLADHYKFDVELIVICQRFQHLEIIEVAAI